MPGDTGAVSHAALVSADVNSPKERGDFLSQEMHLHFRNLNLAVSSVCWGAFLCLA